MQSFAQWTLLIVFCISAVAQFVGAAIKSRGDPTDVIIRFGALGCIFALFFWLYTVAGTYSTIF